MIDEIKLESYARERDKAFIEAVENNNFEPIKKLMGQYDIKMPEDEKIMKAGIYKAVQECTNIPASIKDTAKTKCIKLGFCPYMQYKEAEK